MALTTQKAARRRRTVRYARRIGPAGAPQHVARAAAVVVAVVGRGRHLLLCSFHHFFVFTSPVLKPYFYLEQAQ